MNGRMGAWTNKMDGEQVGRQGKNNDRRKTPFGVVKFIIMGVLGIYHGKFMAIHGNLS